MNDSYRATYADNMNHMNNKSDNNRMNDIDNMNHMCYTNDTYNERGGYYDRINNSSTASDR